MMAFITKLLTDWTTYMMVAGALIVFMTQNIVPEFVGIAMIFVGALFDDKVHVVRDWISKKTGVN